MTSVNASSSDMTHFTNYRCVEIGEGRSRVVTAIPGTISFVAFHPRPGGVIEEDPRKTVILTQRSAKILGDKLFDIHSLVQRMIDGEKIEEEYWLYLGRGYFLTIMPDFSCVVIRKYYRPADDPDRRAPGYPGFVFKLSEFENLVKEWPDLARAMMLHKVTESCSEFDVCVDEDCCYCKLNF